MTPSATPIANLGYVIGAILLGGMINAEVGIWLGSIVATVLMTRYLILRQTRTITPCTHETWRKTGTGTAECTQCGYTGDL